MRLKDRGLIKMGYQADIVIFDPEKIKDRATFDDPLLEPEGILMVYINGKLTVHHGRYTGARDGHVIRAVRHSKIDLVGKM